MGHPQPPSPVHVDNSTAVGIANDSVKKQRSRSMEMRFFWVTDQVNQKIYLVKWHPGQENLADYFTKHFDGKHHQEVRPWYLHETNSPRLLPRAAAPSALRGCVGKLPHGYDRTAPLPRLVTSRVPHGHPGATFPRGRARGTELAQHASTRTFSTRLAHTLSLACAHWSRQAHVQRIAAINICHRYACDAPALGLWPRVTRVS